MQLNKIFIYLNMDRILIFLVLLETNLIYCKKRLSYNHTDPSGLVGNPDYIRDRVKADILRPFLPLYNRKPFHTAWMDYCDPYHCNDYHKLACGLNRKTMRFKWFQSGCHIVLHNSCSRYRGTLKYDMVDTKFCYMYVMYLRSECALECPHDDQLLVCGISSLDNHVALFRNQCVLEATNCLSDSLQEFKQIPMTSCVYFINTYYANPLDY